MDNFLGPNSLGGDSDLLPIGVTIGIYGDIWGYNMI